MPQSAPVNNLRFTAKLFRYTVEPASWYFVETDKALATTIRASAKIIKGFGSIPVQVKVGETMWCTSFFPTKQKTYLLAVKAAVRQKEDLREGDRVMIEIKCV